MAKKQLKRIEAQLRDHGLAFPETHEDFPWGERALKVKGKVFVFMRCEDTLGFSVKLPFTRDEALALPNVKPTGYGLGKAGWVSFSFEADDDEIPVERIKRWIGESYRAVAPKKLVEMLDGPKPKAAPKKKTAKRR